MKLKYILKIAGLISAFSCFSVTLISCDASDFDDIIDFDDSDISDGIGQGSADLPIDVSELENGGIITIQTPSESVQLLITDVASGLGTVTDNNFDEFNNLTFSYDIASSGSITISDERQTAEEALNVINSLTEEGGALEDEINAVLSNDTPENLSNLVSAINEITSLEQFIVGEDFDDRLAIFRSVTFALSGQETLTSFPIVGESNPFSLEGLTETVDNTSIDISYTAP